MDAEAEATSAAHRHVRSGFYKPREVLDIVEEDILGPGTVDTTWLRQLVKNEFRNKREAEATWPEVTDCDRLDQAFESLSEHGIIALQNAGYTQSDGMSDVTEQCYEDPETGECQFIGYCFYHGQDLEGVMESGNLYLTFGDINGDDNKGVEIGQQIRQLLAASGFVVEWDGSIKTRLLVKGLMWQRRGES
jgi:hypothetical protein